LKNEKCLKNENEKLGLDGMFCGTIQRQDQTRPDKTRQDQTRPDRTN